MRLRRTSGDCRGCFIHSMLIKRKNRQPVWSDECWKVPESLQEEEIASLFAAIMRIMSCLSVRAGSCEQIACVQYRKAQYIRFCYDSLMHSNHTSIFAAIISVMPWPFTCQVLYFKLTLVQQLTILNFWLHITDKIQRERDILVYPILLWEWHQNEIRTDKCSHKKRPHHDAPCIYERRNKCC